MLSNQYKNVKFGGLRQRMIFGLDIKNICIKMVFICRQHEQDKVFKD